MRDYEGDLRNFRLAMTGMAACLALSFVFPAEAITIDARLVGFQSTDARLNGSGPAGGIGRFELLTDVTGTDVDFLGTTFMAQCLEPNEFVSTGNTYRFGVVDLGAAPTSHPGGMGANNAAWIESIMGGLGFESVEEVATASAVAQSAIQMATYEAGFETSGVFNFAGGSAVLTGIGSTMTGAVQTARLDPVALDGFGLLNVSQVPSPLSRTVYTGQDFAVYRTVNIPEPGIPALLSLGLIGLAGFTRWKQD